MNLRKLLKKFLIRPDWHPTLEILDPIAQVDGKWSRAINIDEAVADDDSLPARGQTVGANGTTAYQKQSDEHARSRRNHFGFDGTTTVRDSSGLQVFRSPEE